MKISSKVFIAHKSRAIPTEELTNLSKTLEVLLYININNQYGMEIVTVGTSKYKHYVKMWCASSGLFFEQGLFSCPESWYCRYKV